MAHLRADSYSEVLRLSLSGVLDLASIDQRPYEPAHAPEGIARRVFGSDIVGTDDDLLHVLERSDPTTLPPLYAYAGEEDQPNWDGHLRFGDAADRLGVDITTDFGPGTHEWGYWDDKIQEVLAWLPLAR